jgi:hypothetical protein
MRRAAADKAGDRAASPSRRRALKAALASAPIIMSIKSRPAFANRDGDDTRSNLKDQTLQNSSSMSHNMSSKPSLQK